MKTLILTKDCGLNCSFCYQGTNKAKQYMTIETADKILNREGDKFSLFGGEPFKNKDVLLHILENHRDKKFTFTTNILETDMDILKIFIENGMIHKKIIFSADVIGANIRYDSSVQHIVDNRIIEALNILKKFNLSLRINIVINSKDFDKYADTYIYYSNIVKGYNNVYVNINIDTGELITEENVKQLFDNEYYRIMDYDFDNYSELRFNMFRETSYDFCYGWMAYDWDGTETDCHHSFFEKKSYSVGEIKEKCSKCGNKYCTQCIFTNFNHCLFYKKLEEFIRKEI